MAILGWMALGVVAWFLVGFVVTVAILRSLDEPFGGWDEEQCEVFAFLVAYWPFLLVAVVGHALIARAARGEAPPDREGDDHV